MYVTGTEKTKMKNEKNSISQRFMQNTNWSFSGKKSPVYDLFIRRDFVAIYKTSPDFLQALSNLPD